MAGEYERAISIKEAIDAINNRDYLLPAIQSKFVLCSTYAYKKPWVWWPGTMDENILPPRKLYLDLKQPVISNEIQFPVPDGKNNIRIHWLNQKSITGSVCKRFWNSLRLMERATYGIKQHHPLGRLERL